MNNLFTEALKPEKRPAERIIVFFRNGRQAEYTRNIFEMLKSDPETSEIISKETGEIIFSK